MTARLCRKLKSTSRSVRFSREHILNDIKFAGLGRDELPLPVPDDSARSAAEIICIKRCIHIKLDTI
ncbi:hypothetical protein BRADI_4g25182v3 [Brachypodium distachyon]|uniref:Uncharacterized protein n=1 Tax=Brachypodium distachyon TaxID=15368 RepID=A0A2K2CQ57_BRADI|nr:hypothetical protein BRADI_4g25182v3 [Brachypodium distachyon]